MFIRASSQIERKSQRVYTTYRLVESYRNQDGKVRQNTLLNLGCNFDLQKSQWKPLADRVEEIVRGQASLLTVEENIEKEAQRIAKLVIKTQSTLEINYEENNARQLEQADFLTVDINSLNHQDIRKIGAEHVGYHAAKQLQLDEILRAAGFNEKQVSTALASIISRLVRPGSELNTYGYLTQQSALDELMEKDFSNFPLNNLYKISDKLMQKKEFIEENLYRNELSLFKFEEVVTLYDITNTYFEGRGLANPKAQHGRSKEKRSDCRLVALGLVLDSSGFPKKSSIFPGNVSEPKTLAEMIKNLTDNKKAIIVMDAGFSSEDNILWLKESGYKYIVVSRKPKLTIPENIDTVIMKENKNNLVTASIVENKKTGEHELYCHSTAKAAREDKMQSKAEKRFETELQKLAAGLRKPHYTKIYEKVTARIGRLREGNRRVSKLYEITVKPDAEKLYAVEISWNKIEGAKVQSGIYCLRTNSKDLDAKMLWNTYIMLTDLEAAFRSLKSELGLRPIFHQKETRVDGHIFISIIAYHLLHTIRFQLKKNDIHDSWETLRKTLDTHCRITSTMRLKDGRVVKIRKTSSPNANQALIYKALDIASHPCKTEKAYF